MNFGLVFLVVLGFILFGWVELVEAVDSGDNGLGRFLVMPESALAFIASETLGKAGIEVGFLRKPAGDALRVPLLAGRKLDIEGADAGPAQVVEREQFDLLFDRQVADRKIQSAFILRRSTGNCRKPFDALDGVKEN